MCTALCVSGAVMPWGITSGGSLAVSRVNFGSRQPTA
jgi:hypothetical protein